MNGTVKSWNATRGFGFITSAEHPDDVFVHVTALRPLGLKELVPGDQVEFDLTKTPKGAAATNIRFSKPS